MSTDLLPSTPFSFGLSSTKYKSPFKNSVSMNEVYLEFYEWVDQNKLTCLKYLCVSKGYNGQGVYLYDQF